MPRVDAVVHCPLFDSFRVQQVAGMFDLPLAARLSETFAVDLPDMAGDWQIGLITGPSGSGKSTVARAAFSQALAPPPEWSTDRAVIDAFPTRSLRDATALLNAVGLGSPPAWVKPYHVLSRGEQFRCDLARALAVGCPSAEPDALTEPPSAVCTTAPARADGARITDWPLVVFDEFTSVVDRTVAQVASAAVARALRRGHVRCRFVAVTCHYDVAEWLAPDWMLDMATRTTHGRLLRRPRIKLQVFRCRRTLWPLFARHHYLSGTLNPVARTFVALWRGVPVAFAATVPLLGQRGRWRISRLVTLPEYQGIGIGMRLAATVAQLHHQEGHRVSITASHPAVLEHCRRSPCWRLISVAPAGHAARRGHMPYRGSAGRSVASFAYVLPATSAEDVPARSVREAPHIPVTEHPA